MSEIYAKFLEPTIAGDSEDKLNVGWIELESFSVNFYMPTTERRSGAGSATVGKVDMGDFNFTKIMDTSSVPLTKNSWMGTHFKKIEVKLYRGFEDGRACYLNFLFEDAVLTSSTTGASGYGLPMENYSINYGKLFVKYTPTDHATGKASSNTITAGYNRITNKAS